ncbi:DUF2339 domain-containing protein [Pseudozobellia thermophila]|uniref:Phage shock protein C (PspC) family protein n=1 Tax=Pseudozobellia thermophila TaxID=192903 RepID=A0A1M6I0W2_9FLAO|nr:DUF2339 domain-containing protein [Pseudozobellia thermophila]SHJ28113.1 phage shock protein C (PspC) family protein [Pseudozobellia thermophila]
MPDQQNRITELEKKLERLLSKQERFAEELMVLYKEIEDLKKQGSKAGTGNPKAEVPPLKATPETAAASVQQTSDVLNTGEERNRAKGTIPKPEPTRPKRSLGKSGLEKFIGENLINKIGIAITVIGVAIGAKYSIDNDLISPLTRIILGYLFGLGLLGFAIKLKKNYKNYSAVLTSGALAILYFITFAAYNFYGLYGQLTSFGLMVLFTVFGVVASLHYDKQVIAHIGLVGAYAVPFLLSDGSGQVSVLFGYMAIINIGILAISIKRYWKPLFYSAFVFTWLIFVSWCLFSYEPELHFGTALGFSALFHIVFYLTFLLNKLANKETFLKSDVVLLLLNSFIFYGIGYGLLNSHTTGERFLGLFTIGNAMVHFIVCLVLYRKKLADRDLFHLIAGMVLVFITIAIPVQLDGNWVTLLWITTAVLLFWIGRTQKIGFYEYLAYPLILLAFVSLVHDWSQGYSLNGYDSPSTTRFVANIYFFTSLIFITALGLINRVHRKNIEGMPSNFTKMARYGLPGMFLVVLYLSFHLEIEHYWRQSFIGSAIVLNDDGLGEKTVYNYDLKDHGIIWTLNYALAFLMALAFVNILKIKDRTLAIFTLLPGLLTSLLFLSLGLYTLSELREGYLSRSLAEYYDIGFANLGIRYVAIAFFIGFLVAIRKLVQQPFMKMDLKIPFELAMQVSILWILSSELLNWMDIMGSNQMYKLGLSILWGVYSLALIVVGIWKQRKYLRFGAIGLFGLTLLKLFFYDIASLSTLSKTIVFVSLGVLLLIISFLYNKYKNLISDEKTDSTPQ